MAAFDFPASPANGAVYTLNGVTYVYNGYAWTQGTNMGVPYLPLAGGTLSGNLTIDKAAPYVFLNKPASGSSSAIFGRMNGLSRWTLNLGDSGAESGGNAGSDFTINNFNDAGTFLGSPLTINRATGLTTLTGDLLINKANPILVLNKTTSAENALIRGQVNGVNRWVILPASSTPETGSNAGSDFQINRYSDAGAYIDSPLTITRASGNAAFSGSVTSAATLTANQNIHSSTAAMVLATTGVGSVNLRPNNGSTTNEFTITGNGYIKLGQGFYARPGVAGLIGGNAYNLNWIGGGTDLWVDATNTGRITVASDYRVKKDVADLPSMWEVIKDLRPISYTQAEYSPPSHLERETDEEITPLFESDDIERWGFIAHELQETLLPSAATGVKDQDDCIQSPNPWTIIAALTKTVQELQARVEALEAS